MTSIKCIEHFLPEGEYYRYDKTTERIVDRFVNVTEEIIQRFGDYYRIRDESYLKSYIDTIDDEKRLNYFLGQLYKAKDVHSYHVNVGHGNCTFIVFQINGEYQMWAVDCSGIDFLKRNNNAQYVLNVDKCLADIKAQYHIDEISVLMVTHLHYDHINGIDYLIRNGYINSNTKVWMNILYPCKMATYNKILSKLLSLKCRFTIPVSSNSLTPNMEIKYPDKNFDVSNPPPCNHINNASVLFLVRLMGKSMLFTGDLETQAWPGVKSIPDSIDYYCISHHGSYNGRPHDVKYINQFNKCRCKILMGRDGAYSGIFCKTVLKEFSNIKITSPDITYLELDWETGICVIQ